MDESEIAFLAVLLVTVPVSLVFQKRLRSNLVASITSAAVSSGVLNLAGILYLGYADAFILIGFGYMFLVSFVIAYLFGYAYRRRRGVKNQR
jgi:hypothetical protein